MTHAAFALQKAVYALLSGDADLTSLTGGPRVHDGPPRDAPVPFVALDPVVTRNADGDIAPIEEHSLTLAVLSRAGGKREVYAITERIVALLHDADLALDGHRLVGLRAERQEVRQLADKKSFRGDLRFRAVTEPLV
ncbi:hypothetical protein GGD81_004105 [Rhodobium orientis]|uniref:DUF3168 domain-containing protein n=1 Tax=Rhodobium orientis TaxID=34017 RepID=A0A327JFE1_9HYPH|nr:DUF3168 domain-containing protein [Rhodobium orientis]MBB4305037.1 hypothetical protein [Rhodobium orientis]MBK5949911.1 hypothetical protein [Rhodobium orientis]RAI24835.1 hypothetical protein CH339_20850 [Rhodobium orientis]